MGKFVRPALCRLCKFPIGTSGVRLSDVDFLKLSRWWKKELKTDFEDDSLEEQFICQFCLCDAKFQGEQEESDGCDWWKGLHVTKIYGKFYYEEEHIRPCQVGISPMKLPSVKHESTGRVKTNLNLETKCVHCPEIFESRRAAILHTAKAHADIKTFVCHACLMQFKTQLDKDVHRKTLHVRPRTIWCHLCSSQINERLFLNHITKNHFLPGLEYFECCKLKFSNVNQLFNHMKSVVVKKTNVCVYCKMASVHNTIILRHIKRCHASEAIKCPYVKCGKYFLTENERGLHIAEVHKSREGIGKCIYCELHFPKNNLRAHIMRMHKSESIRCNYNNNCAVYFHTEEERRQHVTDVHLSAKVNLLRYNCNECQQSLSSKNVLRHHIVRKHGLKPRFCTFERCHEYFTSASQLENHFLLRHSADEKNKKFHCSQCSFKTIHLHSLKCHVWQRHGNKKIRCKVCLKTFECRQALYYHNTKIHKKAEICCRCDSPVRYMGPHLKVLPCYKCKVVLGCRGLARGHIRNCNRK